MSENDKFYQFRRFRFNAHRLCLHHANVPVHLPPKSLEVLKVLLDEPGEVVGRDLLIDQIWDETFVEEANLTVTISRLRKALGEFDPDEIFIQTVPRVGYRFVADVEVVGEVDDDRNADKQFGSTQDLAQPAHPAKTPKTQRVLHGRRIFYVLAALALVAIGSAAWVNSTQTDVVAGSSDAMQAFTKGDFELSKRRPCESVPYFQEAVKRDPEHALAFARMAAAQTMCGSMDDAKISLDKAFSLDPDLSDAHAVEGFRRMGLKWDWVGAEASLKRALEIDPNSARAHHWLGVLYSIRGRLSEAGGEMQRAIDIAPGLPLYHADICQVYYFRRQYERAEHECRTSLDLDPDFFFANEYLRDINLQLGNDSAAADFEVAVYGKSGNEGELIQQIRDKIDRGGFPEYWRSQLDRAAEERDFRFENIQPPIA